MTKAWARVRLDRMNRRDFLKTGLSGGAAAWAASATASARPAAQPVSRIPFFEWEEATISKLHSAMLPGRLTAASLTRQYLARIRDLDQHGPKLNSVIEVNPDALADRRGPGPGAQSQRTARPAAWHSRPDQGQHRHARPHDDHRRIARPGRGDSRPPTPLSSQRLRAAGAVILGKTNLSEWANFRSTHSTSGWSGRGGQTRNPYALDRNPLRLQFRFRRGGLGQPVRRRRRHRNRRFHHLARSYNGIVGIKPTLGLVSRSGIVPIAHSQDTAGSHGAHRRGRGHSAGLPGRHGCRGSGHRRRRGKMSARLHGVPRRGGLRGARLGVARKFFGIIDAADKLMEDAIAAMKKPRRADQSIRPTCRATENTATTRTTVLLVRIQGRLEQIPGLARPVRAGAFARRHHRVQRTNKAKEMPWFGQEMFLKAQARGPLTEKAYLDALAPKPPTGARGRHRRASWTSLQLDAIVAPTTGPAQLTDLLYGDRDTGGCTTPRGRRRLPAHHRADGIGGRPARRPVLLRPRVERADAAGPGLRLRAIDQGAPTPALPRHPARRRSRSKKLKGRFLI